MWKNGEEYPQNMWGYSIELYGEGLANNFAIDFAVPPDACVDFFSVLDINTLKIISIDIYAESDNNETGDTLHDKDLNEIVNLCYGLETINDITEYDNITILFKK